MKKLCGGFLIGLALLVGAAMIVNSLPLWFAVDALMILGTGAVGILLWTGRI